jgi:TPP-dependent pyruvate/acetoin dehydrogenase alpha subunit
LIEAVSLRWRGHAGHDPAKYVPCELLEHYMPSKDPVKNFEAHLLSLGVVDERRSPRSKSAWSTRSRRVARIRARISVPGTRGRPKGVWVEDGYWRSEPGRNGGTEAG